MKLSIITVNKNNCTGLKKTIESILVQTFKNYELIVIDGDSKDESVEEIKEYPDLINYWVSEPDSGIYNAMNKGIRIAKGEYCLFLNSGDCLADLNSLKNVFDLNLVEDIIYGNIKLNGKIYRYPEKLSLYNIRWGVLPHQASFIKRELFEKYGLYNEKYRIASDWEFWIKTIINHNCSYKYIDILVTMQEPLGVSAVLDCEEGMEILLANIPERILIDYDRLKELETDPDRELLRFLKGHPFLKKGISLFKRIIE